MDAKEVQLMIEAYQQVYAPQEEIEEAEKWIQKAIKKPGALHKQLGVPEGEKIPAGKLSAAAKKGGKLGKRARLAQTLSGLKKEEVQVDEAVKGASRHDTEMRKAAASERKAGVKNRLAPSEGKANAAKMQRDIKFYDKITKKTKPSVVGMTHEEVEQLDFDTMLEKLQNEGHSYEQAIKIMVDLV